MSSRDFIQVFNKMNGKWQFQHKTGGEFFDSLKEVNYKLLIPSFTGLGHQPVNGTGKVTNTIDDVEDIGNKIIKGLKNKQQTKNRIDMLIRGSGLQIN